MIDKKARLASAADLLSTPDPTDWVVRPLLVGRSAMMLYGRPGLGKTTLAMQLACALATDQPDWLHFPLEAHGPVVWLQLDMPRPELKLMLKRAVHRWPDAASKLFFFQLSDSHGQEVYDVDVLRGDADMLAQALAEVKPVALFVDTVADTYEPDVRADQNSQVRKVIRTLRRIASGGAIVYLHHQRKRMQQAQGDDADSYLGGMAFAGTATSVFQLHTTEEGPRLILRKSRLAALGFDRLDLTADADGFFSCAWPAKAALKSWPWGVPPALRGAADRESILEALSQHFGLERATLRQALHRLPPTERPEWA